MNAMDLITEKVNRVKDEMKNNGLWKKEIPAWVSEYEEKNPVTDHDFSEWLQFVYLPNLLQQAENNGAMLRKKNIVPQAINFFGEDMKKGKLLQLLVELDSLP